MTEPDNDNDQPKPPSTLTGMMMTVSENLIRVLPPAFLLLVIINAMFLAVMMWVFGHNMDTRNALLTKIVEECLTQTRTP